VLLGVVAELEPMTRVDLAGVGVLDAAQDPQQRRLARAVEPQDDDLRAAVDDEVCGDADIMFSRTVFAVSSVSCSWA